MWCVLWFLCWIGPKSLSMDVVAEKRYTATMQMSSRAATCRLFACAAFAPHLRAREASRSWARVRTAPIGDGLPAEWV